MENNCCYTKGFLIEFKNINNLNIIYLYKILLFKSINKKIFLQILVNLLFVYK